MDSSDRFWIALFSLLAAVIIMGMLCGTVGAIADRNTMVKLVRAGADPVEAACALRLEAGNKTSTCAALMGQRK